MVNTDVRDLYSYLLFQFIVFNQIVQGFTGVSLVISDEAPRQESHHQRCKERTEQFSMIFQTRSQKENTSTTTAVLFFVFTCFSNSAAPDHSHLDDPAEGRVFGRGALRDRRHVVDETHFFFFFCCCYFLSTAFGRQIRTKTTRWQRPGRRLRKRLG